jgi:hypothetical protein
MHGNAFLSCQFCGSPEPYLFARIVLVGEEAGHISPECQQFLKADISDLVIGEDN